LNAINAGKTKQLLEKIDKVRAAVKSCNKASPPVEKAFKKIAVGEKLAVEGEAKPYTPHTTTPPKPSRSKPQITKPRKPPSSSSKRPLDTAYEKPDSFVPATTQTTPQPPARAPKKPKLPAQREPRAPPKKTAKTSNLIGNGSELRKVEFFDGLQHAKNKHIFGIGRYSLKVLDPKGNPNKWTQHIIELAQRGDGLIKNIPTGQIMEIRGTMPKTNESGMLKIGVRLFKANNSTTWELTTILTRQ